MNSQKNRGFSKKTKQSKSQKKLQSPLKPLIQQINHLKSELASIKSERVIKSGVASIQQQNKSLKDTHIPLPWGRPQLKQNKTLSKISSIDKSIEPLKQIIFPVKQHQLQINTEINKLKNNLKLNKPKSIKPYFNKIITTINNAISLLPEPSPKAKDQQTQTCNYDSFYNSNDQSMGFQQINSKLETQNKQHKQMLMKQIGEISHLQSINEQLKIQNGVITNTMLSLQHQLQKMTIICNEIRHERQQLQQKIKIYEKSIQKKQSQLLIYEQDIKNSEKETQKYKSQKKQIQKLYENLQKQHKQLKAKYQNEIELREKQKNHWKNECQKKKAQENEKLNYEQHKNELKKQLERLIQQINSLNEVITVLKSRLQKQQKQNLILQQQNYKLTIQYKKVMRNIQNCKMETQQLTKQLDQLKDEVSIYQQITMKNEIGGRNTHKIQALEQINELIKKHRKFDS